MLVELLLGRSATISSLEYGHTGSLTFGTSVIVTAALVRLRRSPPTKTIEKKRLFIIVSAIINIIKINDKLRTNTYNEKGVDNEKVKRNIFSAILKMQKMHSELKSISEGIFFQNSDFFSNVIS